MSIKISSACLKYIKVQTQLNDHGAAYACAAKAMGNTDLGKQFDRINYRQMQLGYLPLDLYEERNRLYQKLKAYAKEHLSPSDYRHFYMAT